MAEYVRKSGTRELVDVAAGHGTSMQVLVGSEEAPNFALRKFIMEPHGGMPKHTNSVEHEQYVVRGSGTIEIANKAYEIVAGDSVFIPSNVPHSYVAGKDGLEFICVIPNKEDNIKLVE
ncbi:MAG: cupin domain-containing protein [Candidatus Thiodiazotropha sp.]